MTTIEIDAHKGNQRPRPNEDLLEKRNSDPMRRQTRGRLRFAPAGRRDEPIRWLRGVDRGEERI